MKNPLNAPGEVNFADIIRVFSQRRRVIFQSVFVTFCVVMGVTLLMRPIYQATTKVLLKEEALQSSNLLPAYSRKSLEEEGQILRSKPIISQALENVAKNDKSDKTPDIASIQKSLSVDIVNKTNILAFSVDHKDPRLAASLANAVVGAYTDYRSAAKIKLINAALHTLSRELSDQKRQLRLAEKTLDEYSKRKQVAILPESEIVTHLQRFAGADALILAVNSDIQRVATKIEEIKKEMHRRAPGDLSVPFAISDNAMVKGFRADIRATEGKLSDLLVEFTPRHPEVIAAQRELEKIKAGFRAEMPNIIALEISSAEMEKKLMESKREVLLKENASQGARLNEVLFSQPKLAGLLNDVRTERGIYQGLLNRQRDIRMFKARSSRTPEVIILEVAATPTRPIRPKPLLNSFLAVIVGLSIGCSIALLFPAGIGQQRQMAEELAIAGRRAGKDRRELVRADISREVIYNILGRPEIKHRCMSKNISGSGIRLITDEKLAMASVLELKIPIREAKSIYAKGEVIWASEVSVFEDGRGPFSIGIRFIDIGPNDKELLLQYINEEITLSRRRNV